ncbi:Spy/CpxP family protein refolding chaperone, partial [Caulobacter endophyticus]
ALAAGVVAASAQPAAPPPPPAAPEAPQPPPPPPSFGHMVFRDRVGPVRAHQDPEARVQRLRDVLQLTDRQEGALKAYVAATGPRERPEPKPVRDEGAKDKSPPTALERLDEQAERMAKVAADLKGRADATRAFYNALSPSQKKAFDALGPEVTGGPNVSVRRFETRGPRGGFGERRVIIQRKSGS